MIVCDGRPVTLLRLRRVYQAVMHRRGEVQDMATRGAQRPKHFRNIVHAARTLGVTRQHLYLVLKGRRQSHRIMRALTIRRAS